MADLAHAPSHIRSAVRETVTYREKLGAMRPTSRTYTAVQTEYERARNALRKAVIEFAATLRADDAPPEAMVIAIKHITLGSLTQVNDPGLIRDILQTVVLWGVKGYYGVSVG